MSSGALTGVHKSNPCDTATIRFGDKANFSVEQVDSREF